MMAPDLRTANDAQNFISVACVSCAKDKTRCDHLFPCGRCSTKGISCLPRTPRRVPAAVTTVRTASPLQPAAPTNTWNDPDEPMPDVSPGQETFGIAHASTPLGRRLSQQFTVFESIENGTGQPPQHTELQQGLDQQTLQQNSMFARSKPTEADVSNSFMNPEGGPDPDFDLSFFLTFAEPDTSANLDWARFLESPSSDLYLPDQHVDGSSSQVVGASGGPLTARTVTNPYSQAHDMQAQVVSNDMTVDAAIEDNNMTPDSLSRPYATASHPIHQTGRHDSIQFNAAHSTLDRSAATLTTDQDILQDETRYWSICQCTPPPTDTAPIRSGESVAALSENLGGWTLTCGQNDVWRQQNFQSEEMFKIVAISESTRERLLVIMQLFFRWASELYNIHSRQSRKGYSLHQRLARRQASGFLLLPPTPTLHNFLECFLSSFEPYYPLVREMTLDPNRLVTDTSENMSVLLLALMTAYGMMRDEDSKGQGLAAGMIELCRVALTNLVERDTEMPRSPVMFHCALLCTFEAAFSGDKYLMDFSQGQKYLFLGVSTCRA